MQIWRKTAFYKEAKFAWQMHCAGFKVSLEILAEMVDWGFMGYTVVQFDVLTYRSMKCEKVCRDKFLMWGFGSSRIGDNWKVVSSCQRLIVFGMMDI